MGTSSSVEKQTNKGSRDHTLSHQCDGVHVEGNSLADEAAKGAVCTASVAAITHSKMRLDSEIMLAVNASSKGSGATLPKKFPLKYSYIIDANNVPFARIPGVGDRVIPNMERRSGLILAAHEGIGSAHAGVSATVSLLKQRYWWPGMRKQTKNHVLECDIASR